MVFFDSPIIYLGILRNIIETLLMITDPSHEWSSHEKKPRNTRHEDCLFNFGVFVI
jgi:hypothetical protein